MQRLWGRRWAPSCFQLPPTLRKDADRLASFLSLLPSSPAVAMEFRHPTWFDEQVLTALGERNCAICITETDESEPSEMPATANWGYVRLRRAHYTSDELARWKNRISSATWKEAYVFFKHEDEGIGPRLAAEFLQLFRP